MGKAGSRMTSGREGWRFSGKPAAENAATGNSLFSSRSRVRLSSLLNTAIAIRHSLSSTVRRAHV